MSDRRIALVTGGSRGIGRAICIRLAKDGFDIVFNCRSKNADAQKTVELCEEYGAKVLDVACDISVSSDCDKLIKEALSWEKVRELLF